MVSVCDPRSIVSLAKQNRIEFKSSRKYAAVAIIVHENKLVIEKRITNKDDPWSGQFSLPGGHFEAMDQTLYNTALREVMEETGIDLNGGSEYIGYLGPFSPGNRRGMDIYAYIFVVPEAYALKPSPESENLYWVDIQSLRDNEDGKASLFKFSAGDIWGLTARILREFFKLCS